MKEALIAFSEREDVSVIAGTEKKITVTGSKILKFPLKNTPERQELEKYLEKTGVYAEVSSLDTYALAKFILNREWDDQMLKELERYTSEEISYRLNISKRKDDT